MSKVNPDKYGNAKPKITQDDLADGDFAVVTIAGFGEQTFEDGKEKKLTPYLLTEEFGDKVLWLNRTQTRTLIDRLGDDSDKWTGKRVPIVKHTASFGTSTFKKVIVPDVEEWDDLLAMAAEESGSKPKKPRKLAGSAKPPVKKKRGK